MLKQYDAVCDGVSLQGAITVIARSRKTAESLIEEELKKPEYPKSALESYKIIGEKEIKNIDKGIVVSSWNGDY